MLKINPEWVCNALELFIREELNKIGVTKAIFGLSGGVDSAVVACLAQRALGSENVHALIMPYRLSNPESQEHAELQAKAINISYDVVDISEPVDAFFKTKKDADSLRKGNRMARERMCHLYDYSSASGALVLGTSNKTELLVGYGTIFGDLASAVNPIGDLYKSQIWDLARYLNVPEEIINKAPSADLWEGQTDEEELGYSYAHLDKLLFYLVDERYPDAFILENGYDQATIDDIKKRIQRSQFKRRPPIIAKLSNRTINQDFRYCRDWGV
jgi:NAD+ synthase